MAIRRAGLHLRFVGFACLRVRRRGTGGGQQIALLGRRRDHRPRSAAGRSGRRCGDRNGSAFAGGGGRRHDGSHRPDGWRGGGRRGRRLDGCRSCRRGRNGCGSDGHPYWRFCRLRGGGQGGGFRLGDPGVGVEWHGMGRLTVRMARLGGLDTDLGIACVRRCRGGQGSLGRRRFGVGRWRGLIRDRRQRRQDEAGGGRPGCGFVGRNDARCREDPVGRLRFRARHGR